MIIVFFILPDQVKSIRSVVIVIQALTFETDILDEVYVTCPIVI